MGSLDQFLDAYRRNAIAGIEQRQLHAFLEELRGTLRTHSHADWLVIAVTYREQERPSGAMEWFPASAVAMTDNSEQHLEMGVESRRQHDAADRDSVTRTEYEWARRGGEWTEWAGAVLSR
jgi:hypothetical protein